MLLRNDSRLNSSIAVNLTSHVSRLTSFTNSKRSAKSLLCNNYALCIMNYALKEAHGWDPVTALLTVGYHPRLGSCHHYVVPCGIFVDRGLSPTAGIPLPLRGFKWLPCNNYALCITHYELAISPTFSTAEGGYRSLSSRPKAAIVSACALTVPSSMAIAQWQSTNACITAKPSS